MSGLPPSGVTLADNGAGQGRWMGEVVVEEEEKMRFCNVGRRRCLVLA